MLEVITHGLFVGAPFELSAAGAIVTLGGEEIARFQESHGPRELRSALAAELAILTAALEWLRLRGGMGEVVTVRTGLGSLGPTCRGRGEASRTDVRRRLARLETIARDFEGIHAVVSPSWITEGARDLALRSLLARAPSRAGAGEVPA